MARQLRIQYAGAVYHVMNRGDRREEIFRDAPARRRWPPRRPSRWAHWFGRRGGCPRPRGRHPLAGRDCVPPNSGAGGHGREVSQAVRLVHGTRAPAVQEAQDAGAAHAIAAARRRLAALHRRRLALLSGAEFCQQSFAVGRVEQFLQPGGPFLGRQ